MKTLIFIGILLISIQSSADFLLELGGGYSSDAIKTPTTSSKGTTYYNAGFLFTLNKGIWGGWNYGMLSTTDTTSSTTTFSSTDTGPYMKWQFGKDGVFNVGFNYNLSSKATYTSSGTTEDWEGTSMWLSFGVVPPISDTIHVGANLNYFSATYSKKVVSSTESTASNSKTMIFPTIVFTKQW